MNLNILSINSCGFNSRKENLIFNQLRSASPAIDICCVQDVMISDPVFFRSLASRWRGPCFWSPSIGRGGGSVVFVSESFEGNISTWRKDTDGRVISLLIELYVKINLVSIYAPTALTGKFSSSLFMNFFCLRMALLLLVIVVSVI